MLGGNWGISTIVPVGCTVDVLLAWHRQDPVSIKEINRADAVNN
ncbi:MAG: endonuclease, partial [Paludibacteraceae bacterium]|nr:endonuclease [Paludibacteraceae bacterium]